MLMYMRDSLPEGNGKAAPPIDSMCTSNPQQTKDFVKFLSLVLILYLGTVTLFFAEKKSN